MRNDYRAGRAVLHCVIGDELMAVVRGSAAARGVSITRLVSGILEDALMREPQPEQASTPVPVTQKGPDWDSIMDRGRRARVGSDTVSETVGSVMSAVDPLEDIA